MNLDFRKCSYPMHRKYNERTQSLSSYKGNFPVAKLKISTDKSNVEIQINLLPHQKNSAG